MAPTVAVRTWRSTVSLVGVAVATTAVAVLLGWALEIDLLKSMVPGITSMKPNSAVGLGSLGLALAAASSGSLIGWRRVAWLAGSGMAIFLGTATALQYLAGVDLGIDQLLFVDRDAGLGLPGRPAPATAAAILLLGLAALAIPNTDRHVASLGLSASVVAIVIGFAGLLGALYGAEELVGGGAFFRLALHTSIGLMLLGFAIIAAAVPYGPVAYLAGDSLGGRLARGVIITIVVGLPALGLVRLTGELLGLYSPKFGIVVMVLMSGTALAIVGTWAGRWLDRAEHALQLSEARYRAAKDGGLDAFFLYEAVRDESGRVIDFVIVDANAAGAAYAGRARAALIGARISELSPRIAATAQFRSYVRCIDERTTIEEEFSAPGEGRLEWFVHQLVPVGDGLALSTRRITDRVEAAERLRQANDDLGRSNVELREFASAISHDLRAPLRRIQMFSDAVGEVVATSGDVVAIDHLARIKRSAASMQDLIRDLLEYSRVGTQGLVPVPIDLAGLIRSVASDQRSARVGEADLQVETGPLPRLLGDATQIGQLFANLIGNAVKFAKPGMASHVWITARDVPERPDRTRIVVRDDGIGFDQVYTERMFGIFERVHPANVATGTGVGLAICRRVVERHGGTISATGTPGEGAIFTFDLPLAPGPSPAPSATNGGSPTARTEPSVTIRATG